MPSLKSAPLPEEAQEVGQSWNADLDNDDEFGEYFDGYASYGESLSTPPAETEVAVIGNGPSAICLSYFLSGNWPFYNGQIHPNEILQWHLSEIDASSSLVEQDLSFLSEGLEGRSSNPVAVLFDALTSPDADLGSDLPSCIDFRHEPESAIPYAVFGKGAPGGSWNTIESSLLTVSAGSWMELPGTNFNTWRELSNRKSEQGNRVKVGDISAYYLDYIKDNDLEKNFYSYTKVTSVKKVNPCSELVDSETGEEEICPKCETYHSQKTHWEVKSTSYKYCEGVCLEEENVTKAKYVVLATGSHDDPRKLQVEGEDEFPYVMHSFRELEDAITGGSLLPYNKCKRKKGRGRPPLPPPPPTSHSLLKGNLNELQQENKGEEDEILRRMRRKSSIQEEEEEIPRMMRRKSSTQEEELEEIQRMRRMSTQEEEIPRMLRRKSSTHLCEPLLPLMVVGAGLTAADAITIARSKRIPVIHVFRCKCNNSSLVFHNLPPALFPEYHQVFSMMTGQADPESGGCLQCYTAFQGYEVSQFCSGGEVIIKDRETKIEKRVKCGGVLVCAGARPILDFLENGGRHLGVNGGKKIIDAASNPVEIDAISYECTKESNLFAMGPLVGDNFVRYLRGGALGITNFIWNSDRKSESGQILRSESGQNQRSESGQILRSESGRISSTDS